MTYKAKHPDSLYQAVWLAFSSNNEEKLHELLDITLPNGSTGRNNLLLFHARRRHGDLQGKLLHARYSGGWIYK